MKGRRLVLSEASTEPAAAELTKQSEVRKGNIPKTKTKKAERSGSLSSEKCPCDQFLSQSSLRWCVEVWAALRSSTSSSAKWTRHQEGPRPGATSEMSRRLHAVHR